MANIVTTQTLIDGSRNLIVHVAIVGDGITGDEENTVIVDASEFIPAGIDYKLMKIDGKADGCSAILAWDATTRVPFLNIPLTHDFHGDYMDIGGLINNAGIGKTGDVLITTRGLGELDSVFITMWLKKNEIPVTR